MVTVQAAGGPYKCHKAYIDGPSELVYGDPLSCGARVYIETVAHVRTEIIPEALGW